MIGRASGYSAIGLDVGSRCIKAVQFARSRKGLNISAIACIERSGKGERGTLLAAEAGSLREVFARQGFRGRAVVLAGAPGRMLSGVMELPPRSSGAPIDQIARMELARANGCPPDSLELSWWELPAGKRAQDGTHVFAVGLRHADAHEAIDGLEAAGMEVRALDSGTLGISRLCALLSTSPATPVTGLLDIGWSGTSVAVLLGTTLVYQRLLPAMGMSHLHSRLVSELLIDAEAAEFVIRRVGVSNELSEEQRNWELLEDARSVVADHADSISAELKASLSYATRRHDATGAASVLASGGGASVPGLLDRVQRASEERIRAIRPADIAASPKDPLAATLAMDPRLACAAGLALEPTAALQLEAATA